MFDKLAWGRCTRKVTPDGKTRLYLHVFDWPASGRLTVPGLVSKPSKVSLLADGRSLEAAAVDGQLAITVPRQAPDKIATVVVLDL